MTGGAGPLGAGGARAAGGAGDRNSFFGGERILELTKSTWCSRDYIYPLYLFG